MLDGEAPVAMQPWYKGFKGTIEEASGQRCGCCACVCLQVHCRCPSRADLTAALRASCVPALPQVPTKTSGKSYQICGVINQVCARRRGLAVELGLSVRRLCALALSER